MQQSFLNQLHGLPNLITKSTRMDASKLCMAFLIIDCKILRTRLCHVLTICIGIKDEGIILRPEEFVETDVIGIRFEGRADICG